MNAGITGRVLRQIKRWFGKRSSLSVLVLTYHRVAKIPTDFRSLFVTLRQQHTIPLRLQQLSRALAKGALPGWSVAVACDDGYIDNLYHVNPCDRR
jgi:hypothetical protein